MSSKRSVVRTWLATAFALGSLTSCMNADGVPVDYGPSVSESSVVAAILAGVEGIDPSATQKGAAVQYTTTQSLAGGQVVTLVSVTTLSVTNREELTLRSGQPSSVALTVVESKIIKAKNQSEKNLETDREFRLVFKKGSAMDAYAVEGTTAPLALSKPVSTTLNAGTPVTYHHLSVSKRVSPPPSPVASRADCREVPRCRMTYNSVSFDQVRWRDDKPEKIHFDFVVSPDVPQIAGFNMSPLFTYHQGLMKSCVTMLVKVGETRDQILLMECQEIQDFRFKSGT